MTTDQIQEQRALIAFQIYKSKAQVAATKLSTVEFPYADIEDQPFSANDGDLYYGRLIGVDVDPNAAISAGLKQNFGEDLLSVPCVAGNETSSSFVSGWFLFSTLSVQYASGKVFVEAYKLVE